MSVHNITTKVFSRNWFGHYLVLLYDDKNYKLYEMSKPMDPNGVCLMLSYWSSCDMDLIDYEYDLLIKWITTVEFMDEKNVDLRTAIKIKQEQFYE